MCERFWTLPETGIGRAGQGKRKDDCQLVLDGQWPTGERRENTGITFLVADTMPIALGCQKGRSNRRISIEHAQVQAAVSEHLFCTLLEN